MHLGSRVSALLDGRLPPAEEERAWAHVHECHPCRDLVEREGWIKTRLAGLSVADRAGCEAPGRLKDSLLSTPTATFPIASCSRSRSSLVAIGGGALGAAVVGVLALGTASAPQVERRVPATDITRPTQSATPVSDRADRRERRRQRLVQEFAPVLSPYAVMVANTTRVTMEP